MGCNMGIIFLSIARPIEVFSHRFIITAGFSKHAQVFWDSVSSPSDEN